MTGRGLLFSRDHRHRPRRGGICQRLCRLFFAHREHNRMSVRTPDPMAPCRPHGMLTTIHNGATCLMYRKPLPALQAPPPRYPPPASPVCVHQPVTSYVGGGHTQPGSYNPSHIGYDYSMEVSNGNVNNSGVGMTGVAQQSFTAYGCSEQEYQPVNNLQSSGETVMEQSDPIDIVADVSPLISGSRTPRLTHNRMSCNIFKPGLSRMVSPLTSIGGATAYHCKR